MTIDKVFEKLLAELMIEDMTKSIEPKQYGNQKGISIQHYLIQMIHKILSDTDTSEVTAMLATFVDWKDAFPNQCPTLGIQALIKCGVRSSIIPIIIDYYKGRSLMVKWHGLESEPIDVNGGGPQGVFFGILGYLSQSNESANSVPEDTRFKFVDDLSALEKISLLLIGLASHNIKLQVPNDVHTSNLVI